MPYAPVICGLAVLTGLVGLGAFGNRSKGHRWLRIACPVVVVALGGSYFALVDSRLSAMLPFAGLATALLLMHLLAGRETETLSASDRSR
jgi:hypothetical protein